jgi:toxin ParE1/3/4
MLLSWTPQARIEREAVIEYIAEDNPVAALDQLNEIEEQTALLTTQAKMGRVGRVRGTRELVINRTPFIAIYRIEGQRIEIIRFLHGAQQWPKK